MNNRRPWLPTVVVLLALSVSTANADGRFYAGATIGSARIDDNFDGFGFDSSAVAFRIMAGWRFSDYVAAEFGYLDFGDFDEQFDVIGSFVPASVSANGFTLGLNGALPIGGNFALTARGGLFFWNGTASLNNVTQASPDDTNPYFAAGGRYRLSDRFAVIADYTYYDLEDTHSDVLSIGFEVGF